MTLLDQRTPAQTARALLQAPADPPRRRGSARQLPVLLLGLLVTAVLALGAAR